MWVSECVLNCRIKCQLGNVDILLSMCFSFGVPLFFFQIGNCTAVTALCERQSCIADTELIIFWQLFCSIRSCFFVLIYAHSEAAKKRKTKDGVSSAFTCLGHVVFTAGARLPRSMTGRFTADGCMVCLFYTVSKNWTWKFGDNFVKS